MSDTAAPLKSIVIVGGGYIAVEFAGIFSGLGVETVLVYRGEQILRGFDADIRNHLAAEMKKKGLARYKDEWVPEADVPYLNMGWTKGADAKWSNPVEVEEAKKIAEWKAGNYELPLGIPFKDLLEIAGGVRGGRKLKAVIPGGSSVKVVPGDVMLGVNMDYDSLRAVGSSVGSAAVIVMDETTCMVRTLERISRFYKSESCGQCTPCREGTGWLNRVLKRIVDGQGRMEDLQLLVDVAGRIEGHTICALGDAAAWPVQSFLQKFRHEFEYMIQHRGRSLVDAQPEAA